MFEAMVLLGLNPNEWSINYEDDDGGTLALAIPELRVGMSFQGNDPQPLIDAGWFVVRMNLQEMPQFFHVWESLKEFQTQVKTRRSANEMVKSGSSQENALLAGIIRAGLPDPNRNLVIRRPDGKELTVPDFAWEDVKLAFFVDGLWWHVGKDNKERKDAIARGDSEIIDAADKMSVSRRERDTNNRSELQLMGWRVLECTDKDLETQSGVQKQVKRITQMLRQLRSSEGQSQPVSVSAQPSRMETQEPEPLVREAEQIRGPEPEDDGIGALAALIDDEEEDVPARPSARPRSRRESPLNAADKAPGRGVDGQKEAPETVEESGAQTASVEAESALSLFEQFAEGD